MNSGSNGQFEVLFGVFVPSNFGAFCVGIGGSFIPEFESSSRSARTSSRASTNAAPSGGDGCGVVRGGGFGKPRGPPGDGSSPPGLGVERSAFKRFSRSSSTSTPAPAPASPFSLAAASTAARAKRSLSRVALSRAARVRSASNACSRAASAVAFSSIAILMRASKSLC